MGCICGKGDKALIERKAKADANKKLVQRYFDEVILAKKLEPLDQLVSPHNFTEHSPFFEDGVTALRIYLRQWFESGDKLEVIRIGADEDLVFVHSKCECPGGAIWSVVDLFRVTDTKIGEHWDVRQELPAKATCPRPMF